MSVQQTTVAAALMLSALTPWTVVDVRVNQDTPEMDKVVWVSTRKRMCTMFAY